MLALAKNVTERLRGCRLLEARQQRPGTHPNPLGPAFTGVDLDRGSYRARIRVENALTGERFHITLGRSDTAEGAKVLYTTAHNYLFRNDHD